MVSVPDFATLHPGYLLKRAPYEDEREFRVIYESTTDSHASLNIALPLRCIERITLSPWIPSVLADHLKSTIKEINGVKKLELVRSTLISNERWKKASDTAI